MPGEADDLLACVTATTAIASTWTIAISARATAVTTRTATAGAVPRATGAATGSTRAGGSIEQGIERFLAHILRYVRSLGLPFVD